MNRNKTQMGCAFEAGPGLSWESGTSYCYCSTAIVAPLQEQISRLLTYPVSRVHLISAGREGLPRSCNIDGEKISDIAA